MDNQGKDLKLEKDKKKRRKEKLCTWSSERNSQKKL